MKQYYRVSSIFRDRAGKELRRNDTFNGEADSARDALIQAHRTMAETAGADARIDSIASTCKGADGEQIGTTDYADELDCGTSSSGLMNEIDASMLDGRADTLAADALDAVLTDGQKDSLANAGKAKEVAASGGRGTFPRVTPSSQGTGSCVDEGLLRGDDGRGSHVAGVHEEARPRDPAAETGDASVDADPFRSGRSEQGRGTNGPDAGTPGGNVPGTVGAQQLHPKPNRPLGAPYQGTDIMADILRAKESMECALGSDRTPTAIRLGQSAHDALVKEMERLNRGLKVNGPIVIAGVPVVLHNDPDMAPIQIEVGTKGNSFDMMGLNPGQRNFAPFGAPIQRKRGSGFSTGGIIDSEPDGRYYGAPAWPLPGQYSYDAKRDLIIIDEANDIDPATFEKIREAFRKHPIPAWLTPPEPISVKEFKITTEETDPVEFARSRLGVSFTPEQEQMIRDMHTAGQRKYDRQFLGKWEDDNE